MPIQCIKHGRLHSSTHVSALNLSQPNLPKQILHPQPDAGTTSYARRWLAESQQVHEMMINDRQRANAAISPAPDSPHPASTRETDSSKRPRLKRFVGMVCRADEGRHDVGDIGMEPWLFDGSDIVGESDQMKGLASSWKPFPCCCAIPPSDTRMHIARSASWLFAVQVLQQMNENLYGITTLPEHLKTTSAQGWSL